MKQTAIKYPLYILILCFGLQAKAQKLANVQPSGLYAPADIKIDGKATEWSNQFQAYNKSTSIFYTMANNNDNLFLAIQATDNIIIDKILGGGVTLTISSDNKSLAPVSISSPLLIAASRVKITQKVRSPELIPDAELPTLNNEITNNFKEIGIKGITAITDSAISVYNEQGIKLAGLIDANKAYTYELAIPLKYLNQLSGNTGTFNYSIKLNGAKMAFTAMRLNGQDVDPSSPAAVAMLNRIAAEPGSPMMELTSPTDFSGTYTLVKK